MHMKHTEHAEDAEHSPPEGPIAGNSPGRRRGSVPTAVRSTTVLDAAQKLTASLDGAAQRFEGVDRELAKTLGTIQAGLQGFTLETAGFVSQTDQNLAKAATQLGSLVQNLKATLE